MSWREVSRHCASVWNYESWGELNDSNQCLHFVLLSSESFPEFIFWRVYESQMRCGKTMKFVCFCFFFYGCSVGTGQMAGVELESVSGGLSQSEIGEMRDLSAQHLIRFHDQNPGTTTSKALVITNTTWVYLLISLMCFQVGLKRLLLEMFFDCSFLRSTS